MHDVRSMPMRNNAVGRGTYASSTGAEVAEELFDEDGFSYKELLQQYSGKQGKSSKHQSDSNRHQQPNNNRNQHAVINFNSTPRQRPTVNLNASRAIGSYAQQAGISTPKSTTPIAGAVAPRYRKDATKGDVNLDGQIDNTDKNLMSEYIARKLFDERFHTNLAKKYADKNQLNLYAADIDNDGSVNLSDIIDIKSLIDEAKAEKAVLKGDLNDDGEINGKDIDLMTKYLLEEDVTINNKAADFGNDGKITISDLSELLNVFNDIKEKKSTGIKGDINNDGQVDVDDAMKLIDHLNGKIKGYDIYNNADVDGNGKIDSDDVEAIKNIYTTGKVQKPTGVIGDINNDGKVSLIDVARLQNYVDGNIERSEVYNEDVNGDGKINKADVDAVEKLYLFKGKFQENNGVLGDINNDGKVDAEDLNRLNQHLDGKINYANVNNEDVNGDGRVDRNDARNLSNLIQYGKMETPTGINGDINNDGKVDSTDIDKLNDLLAGRENHVNVYNANVNGDNAVDQNDVAALENLINYGTINKPEPAPPPPPPAPEPYRQWQSVATARVDVYTDSGLTNHLGNEKVFAGDPLDVLDETDNAYLVRYGVGTYPNYSSYKERWIEKWAIDGANKPAPISNEAPAYQPWQAVITN